MTAGKLNGRRPSQGHRVPGRAPAVGGTERDRHLGGELLRSGGFQGLGGGHEVGSQVCAWAPGLGEVENRGRIGASMAGW